jgi:hypothetical protein
MFIQNESRVLARLSYSEWAPAADVYTYTLLIIIFFLGLLNVPPAVVIYLESLAKYLRDASSDEDCNDEVMEISFPPMAMNKTQKTQPTPVCIKVRIIFCKNVHS